MMLLEFPFKSTKTYEEQFPVAYRQWRADSYCNVLHGYALSIHLEFGADSLDARNWIVDFGSLKPLKDQLCDWFDHTTLVAQDDPQREYLIGLRALKLAKITEVERTGCEGIADFLFEHLNGADGWLKDHGYWPRVACTKVEVRETKSNMAMRCLTTADAYRLGYFKSPPPADPVGMWMAAAGESVRFQNKGNDDPDLAAQAERV